VEIDALTLPHMAHGEADCTVKCLWVHDGPAKPAKIIGSLTTGQRVTVWQVEGEWWLVQREDGLTGWSHSGYLKLVAPLVRGLEGGSDECD
jgi:hypothetical protein